MTELMPDMYVLDALANDVEDVESILRMLNSETEVGWTAEWGRPFTKEEVLLALLRLIRAGSVRVYVLGPGGKELGPLDPLSLPGTSENAWFGLTGRGRTLHATWADQDGPYRA